MNGIKSQAVKAIITQPHQRVRYKKFSNEGALFSLEIYGRTPSGRMPIGEEVLGIAVQVVELWSEMVIDHVQVNHHVTVVSATNQAFQVFRPAMPGIRCIE